MGFFTLLHEDKSTGARRGEIRTAHGSVETPVFMPVATQAAVKTLSSQELKASGIEMIISNAYHLFLRPGAEIIRKAGGLHRFMGWDGVITTDSGGFQIFSLAELRKIKKEGVEFRSHVDGTMYFFTPENVVDFQILLGSDIIMPLDECVQYPAEKSYVKNSVDLTLEWAKRSLERSRVGVPGSHSLFGIVQGGTYRDLRKECAESLVGMGMDGYALGGIGVGEPRELLEEMAQFTAALLPRDKVRYLMGVGTPVDILNAISGGIDMFDCVVPTRNGRNGQALTFKGELQLRNAPFKDDLSPIEEGCGCLACQHYTRSYIRHLLNTGEIFALRLISLHNIHFYSKFMRMARESIMEDRFLKFKNEFISDFGSSGSK